MAKEKVNVRRGDAIVATSHSTNTLITKLRELAPIDARRIARLLTDELAVAFTAPLDLIARELVLRLRQLPVHEAQRIADELRSQLDRNFPRGGQ